MVSHSPPLAGTHVIELAGLAPGKYPTPVTNYVVLTASHPKVPFASLLLADYGASILRIDRPHPQAHTSAPPPPTADLLTRHKSSIALNLKSPGGLALLKDLLKHGDVFFDPYRPGVLENLGLYPSELVAANPRLIIARLTGFRRDGKYASMAGHDINYLAVSGALSQFGRKGELPYAPANILADFAGGGLMCAFGTLAALISRMKTGKGQVVDANMVDGSAYLASFMRYGLKTPLWNKPRGENILDGGSPWYDVYECEDGGYMAVGAALEMKFSEELIKGLGLDAELLKQRDDREVWPVHRETFRNRFLEKTRREWEQIFDGKDACCTPVLEQAELERQGYGQRLAVALSETPGLKIPLKEAWKSEGLKPGTGGEDLLKEWLGWKRGKDYKVEQGGLVKLDTSKL